MKRKVQITHRMLTMTAVLGSLLVMAMVTANSIWSSRQTSNATKEAVSEVSTFYLEAMADRRARTISNLINSNFEEMEKATAFFADEKVDTQEELREVIGKVETLLGLKRLALVDEDNIVYTQYTTYTGGSRHAFLEDMRQNDRIVSTVSLYGSSRQLFLAIPTSDLSAMGKRFKACFVQLDISEIVELLALDDPGRTSFALYSKQGVNLSSTEMDTLISKHIFFDAIKNVVSEEVWKEHYDHFANEEPGSLVFSAGGADETLCYVPVKETGWEVAVLIRDSVIQDRIRTISEKNLQTTRHQILFTLIAVLLLASVLLYEIHKHLGDELEEEKENSRTFRNIANTDSLTGVRNKYAYSEKEASINQQIRDGELQKLAVVVGDINNLKYVNDTQGHAAGDQLIRDACSLICEFFRHGAVFRIGGDEFAVILQDKGYDSMQEVVDAFNRKVEENVRENGVVVSIGYSVLKPEDQKLRDVFERADQMMYERKKTLKEMGAKQTRL